MKTLWLVGVVVLVQYSVQPNLPNRPMQPMRPVIRRGLPLPVQPMPGNCLPGMDCLGSLPRPYVGTYERPNPYDVQQPRYYGSDDE